jgi:hypothetical protein
MGKDNFVTFITGISVTLLRLYSQFQGPKVYLDFCI